MSMDYAEPSHRFHNATAWWVASEVTRRHPDLTVVEEYPMDGFYDVLALRTGLLMPAHDGIQINRGGSAHTFLGEAYHSTHLSAFMSTSQPGALVDRVIAQAGLRAPATSPRSTPKTLIYRALAHALRITMMSPDEWDIRAVGRWHDAQSGDGQFEDTAQHLPKFPAAGYLLEHIRAASLHGDPLRHIWTHYHPR